jgi:hypothetical protein
MDSNYIDLNALYFEKNFSSDKYDALIAFLSNSSETIDVLYNNCYGGYRVSDEAKKLYKEYTNNDYGKEERHCPYMIKVFETLGSKRFGGDYSQIESHKIPIYMEYYYSIHEYDGMENVEIQGEWFKYDMIQFVIKSEMSDTQKVEIVKMIIDKPIKDI